MSLSSPVAEKPVQNQNGHSSLTEPVGPDSSANCPPARALTAARGVMSALSKAAQNRARLDDSESDFEALPSISPPSVGSDSGASKPNTEAPGHRPDSSGSDGVVTNLFRDQSVVGENLQLRLRSERMSVHGESAKDDEGGASFEKPKPARDRDAGNSELGPKSGRHGDDGGSLADVKSLKAIDNAIPTLLTKPGTERDGTCLPGVIARDSGGIFLPGHSGHGDKGGAPLPAAKPSKADDDISSLSAKPKSSAGHEGTNVNPDPKSVEKDGTVNSLAGALGVRLEPSAGKAHGDSTFSPGGKLPNDLSVPTGILQLLKPGYRPVADAVSPQGPDSCPIPKTQPAAHGAFKDLFKNFTAPSEGVGHPLLPSAKGAVDSANNVLNNFRTQNSLEPLPSVSPGHSTKVGETGHDLARSVRNDTKPEGAVVQPLPGLVRPADLLGLLEKYPPKKELESASSVLQNMSALLPGKSQPGEKSPPAVVVVSALVNDVRQVNPQQSDARTVDGRASSSSPAPVAMSETSASRMHNPEAGTRNSPEPIPPTSVNRESNQRERISSVDTASLRTEASAGGFSASDRAQAFDGRVPRSEPQRGTLDDAARGAATSSESPRFTAVPDASRIANAGGCSEIRETDLARILTLLRGSVSDGSIMGLGPLQTGLTAGMRPPGLTDVHDGFVIGRGQSGAAVERTLLDALRLDGIKSEGKTPSGAVSGRLDEATIKRVDDLLGRKPESGEKAPGETAVGSTKETSAIPASDDEMGEDDSDDGVSEKSKDDKSSQPSTSDGPLNPLLSDKPERRGDPRSDKTDAAEQPVKQLSNRRTKYTVRKGDTLESIARTQLKDSRLAPMILNINRTRIQVVSVKGVNVALLKIGQVIWLPSEAEHNRYSKLVFAGLNKQKSPSKDEMVPYMVPASQAEYGDTMILSNDTPAESESVGSLNGDNDEKTAVCESLSGHGVSDGVRRSLIWQHEQPTQRIDNSGKPSDLFQRFEQIARAGEKRASTLEELDRELAVRLLHKLSNSVRTKHQDQTLPNAQVDTVSLSNDATRSITRSQSTVETSVDRLGVCSRIVTIRDTAFDDDFTTALQMDICGKWFTVASYEVRHGHAYRYSFYNNPVERPFAMDLPPYIVEEMACEDFRRNWKHYCREFAILHQHDGVWF